MDDSRPPSLSPLGRALAGAALAALVPTGLLAQQQQGARPPADPAAAARRAEEAEAERNRRRDELRGVEAAAALSQAARERLEQEVAAIRADRMRLTAALLDAAQAAAEAEARIAPAEERLATLRASEAAIRRSLAERRETVGEILGVLQRMGRRPPPAILVQPQDMLAALRSAMLLGAVLPELRAEAERLAGDLAELVRLGQAIAAEREVLVREAASLVEQRERVAALVEARQAQAREAEQGLAAERTRAGELGVQARSLQELNERLEREASSARRAAEEARRLAEAQALEMRQRFAASAFRDPARLAPKVTFAEARGLLPRPVPGPALRGFGEPDGSGGTARGVLLRARSGGIVSSPADGWVAYAGPFRSFGRLLIINAGGGYYLVLAGMDRLNVEVGQFVLAGEPVATMGETPSALAGPLETSDPVLYVELRKDGSPIDPGPWWSKSQGEKVRG